jgi:hypothetical protein
MRAEEMIAVIQIYIHHLKGVEVNISPRLPEEMPLLLLAYKKSIDWIHNNNIKLTLYK